MEPTSPGEVAKLNQVIQIGEGKIQAHLEEVVRSTVEETLNALLDAEADRLCQAERYERSEARKDTRAGSYQRQLHTQAGEVTLKVPKLRPLPFETAIIERYRRRESSVEEALVEMYLAGVSVRRVEDITEALWGTRVSPSTVSELNQKIYAQIEAWRNKPLARPSTTSPNLPLPPGPCATASLHRSMKHNEKGRPPRPFGRPRRSSQAMRFADGTTALRS
jgi:transposase-like protein